MGSGRWLIIWRWSSGGRVRREREGMVGGWRGLERIINGVKNAYFFSCCCGLERRVFLMLTIDARSRVVMSARNVEFHGQCICG